MNAARQPWARATAPAPAAPSQGPAIRRKAIGDDRGGRRQSTGLADAHADASEEKLPIGLRAPAQHRERRPGHQGRREYIAPVGAIGQPRNGQAEGHVEQRERNAGEEGNAAVRQVQFDPDGLENRRHDVSIRNVDGVDQAGHQQHVPALHRGGRSGARRVKGGTVQHALTSRRVLRAPDPPGSPPRSIRRRAPWSAVRPRSTGESGCSGSRVAPADRRSR